MQFHVVIKGTPLLVYLKNLPAFLMDYRKIKNQAKQNKADFPLVNSTRAWRMQKMRVECPQGIIFIRICWLPA